MSCAMLCLLTACSSAPKPQAATADRAPVAGPLRAWRSPRASTRRQPPFARRHWSRRSPRRPGAIVDTRFNLALCQTYLGQYESALTQVAQAEAERAPGPAGRPPNCSCSPAPFTTVPASQVVPRRSGRTAAATTRPVPPDQGAFRRRPHRRRRFRVWDRCANISSPERRR